MKQLLSFFAVLMMTVAQGWCYPDYDFSDTVSTGQVLYFKITSASEHNASLIAPNIGSISEYKLEVRNWFDFDKPTGNVVIPESVEHAGISYTITSIGEAAFAGCRELTSVTIPSSVTSVYHDAFYGDISLTSITLGENTLNIATNSEAMGTAYIRQVSMPNTVIITAVAAANTGYYFDHWQDGNDSNPRNVNVTFNATYTAFFYAEDIPGVDNSNCVINQFPYMMDFDSIATLTCWNLGAWSILPLDLYGWPDETTCIFSQSAQNASFSSPFIATPGEYTISWKSMVYNENYPANYSVVLLSTSRDTIFSESLSSTDYVDRTASFSISANDTVRISFSKENAVALFIDDIIISQTNQNPVSVEITDISNTRIYTQIGRIVIEGAKGNTVMLYDAMGRLLETKHDNQEILCFDIPVTGTYLVKVGETHARRLVVVR